MNASPLIADPNRPTQRFDRKNRLRPGKGGKGCWNDLGRWFIERLHFSTDRPDASMRVANWGFSDDEPSDPISQRQQMLAEGSKQLASLNSLILFFRELDPKGMEEREWDHAMEQLLKRWQRLSQKLEHLQTAEYGAEEFANDTEEFWQDVNDLSGRVAEHSCCFDSPQ